MRSIKILSISPNEGTAAPTLEDLVTFSARHMVKMQPLDWPIASQKERPPPCPIIKSLCYEVLDLFGLNRDVDWLSIYHLVTRYAVLNFNITRSNRNTTSAIPFDPCAGWCPVLHLSFLPSSTQQIKFHGYDLALKFRAGPHLWINTPGYPTPASLGRVRDSFMAMTSLRDALAWFRGVFDVCQAV